MRAEQKIFTVLGTIAVVAASSFVGYQLFAKKDTSTSSKVVNTSQTINTSSTSQPTTTTPSASTTPTTTTETTTTTSSSSSYKDGTYTASSDYGVPHGETNSVQVQITVKDGVVTAVKTSHDYSDRESSMYINSFDSSVNSKAVGQKLSSLSPSRIGGASLTTMAFDDALDAIRSQAKA